MATIYIILYLIIFFVLGYIISITLGVVGAPGYLFAGKPLRRSKTRLIISGIISSVFQTYVYLAFVAFAVNWTTTKLNNENAINFVVWLFTFLAIY